MNRAAVLIPVTVATLKLHSPNKNKTGTENNPTIRKFKIELE
jgi:hypothetical protein